MSWFEYSKCILEKVSFDRTLFRKELRKLIRQLSPVERLQLLRWCRHQKLATASAGAYPLVN